MTNQAKKHIVVLALSDLKPYGVSPNDPRSYSYEVVGFEGVDLPASYDGWHTNEAPIKLLIDLAANRNSPIDHIVYLCSELCKTREVDLDGCLLTAEGYFKTKVREHLAHRNLDWLASGETFFVPVDYRPSDPSSSLVDIIAAIGNNATVDVDVSGAQRDALFLLSHMIEFMQTTAHEGESIKLGTTVFANLNRGSDPNTLTRQDDTYALFSLIRGVDAFVRYGRADILVTTFGDTPDTAAGRLCSAMRSFSNNLLLCRMTKIPELLDDVRRELDAYEDWLANASNPTSGERLLGTLIPTIRADFVHTPTEDHAKYVIEIIRWCVERQMLQQALGLYRENAAQIMLDNGYLSIENELTGEKLIDRIRDYSDGYVQCFKNILGSPSTKKNTRLKNLRFADFSQTFGKQNDIIPAENKAYQLAANLLWLLYLMSIRNEIMHAGSVTNEDRRLRIMEQAIAIFQDAESVCLDYDLVGKNQPEERTKALSHDILKGLDALDGRISLRACDELQGIRNKKPAEIDTIVDSRKGYAKELLRNRKPATNSLVEGDEAERQHYILCVLSQPPRQATASTYSLFNAGSESTFTGTYTNDAPVKCLITLAERADDPITGIIYLASKECSDACLNTDGHSRSPEDAFRDTIKRHYDSLGKSGEENPTARDGFFIPLSYAISPKERLEELLDAIGKGNILFDIDITGGPRDAALLISLCAQFMETKYTSPSSSPHGPLRVGMGTSLYSNYSDKTLYRQDSTFELMDLVNGVSSFTEYGESDSLVNYFMEDASATPITPDMLRLCAAMSDFSNALALCRLSSIDDRVIDVHESLDAFEESATVRSTRYAKLKELEDDLRHLSLVEANARLAAITNMPSDATDMAGVSKGIANELSASRMRRGELLFLTLVPRLRSQFIANPAGLSDMERLINLIQWCADRKMLQQALSIYKEKVPECLESAGYVSWESQRANKVGVLTDLVQGKSRDKDGNYNPETSSVIEEKRNECVEWLAAPLGDCIESNQLGAIACALYPQETASSLRLTIPDTHVPAMRAILIWYFYLSDIRNRVMHADSPRDQESGMHTREAYRDALQQLNSAGIIEGDLALLEYSFGDSANISGDLAHDFRLALKSLRREIVIERMEQGVEFRIRTRK